MIIKYAFKELRIYWKMNLIIFIQLVATFFICFLCVSTITYELKYFQKFNDYFKQEGFYIQSALTTKPGGVYPVKDSDELKNHLKAAKVLGYSNVDTLGCKKDQATFLVETRAYDEEIIKNFKPQLSGGNWVDKYNSHSDTTKAVISENYYGFKTGDIVTAKVLVDDGSLLGAAVEIPVEIVGILKDGSEIFGASVTGADDIDYRNCYEHFFVKYSDYPIMLVSKNALESAVKKQTGHLISMYITGTSFITYDSNITDIEREHNLSYIKSNSDVILMEKLNIMKDSNYRYFLNKILQLVPVLFVISIFTIMNQISIRAITLKMQLKNYTIYNICGLSKKMCNILNFTSAAILSAAAFFINLGIVYIFKLLPFSINILIEIAFWQFIACMVIIIINLGLSSILPRTMIRKSTIKEIMKTN